MIFPYATTVTRSVLNHGVFKHQYIATSVSQKDITIQIIQNFRTIFFKIHRDGDLIMCKKDGELWTNRNTVL